MAKTVTITKEAFEDLLRIKEEFDSIIESIELMGNDEFMDSYKKAKKEIQSRDFVDWNEL